MLFEVWLVLIIILTLVGTAYGVWYQGGDDDGR